MARLATHWLNPIKANKLNVAEILKTIDKIPEDDTTMVWSTAVVEWLVRELLWQMHDNEDVKFLKEVDIKCDN